MPCGIHHKDVLHDPQSRSVLNSEPIGPNTHQLRKAVRSEYEQTLLSIMAKHMHGPQRLLKISWRKPKLMRSG